MTASEPRESIDFDVVIVGGGPAGLSAAIRLRQLSNERGEDLSVAVIEKGAEIGAHILSGAVIDPCGLDKLMPDWRDKGAPVTTKVTRDKFYFMTKNNQIPLPVSFMPPLMNNHGNYIVSLGSLCRWLGEQAEALDVQIFPGFAASELLYGDDGRVVGVATGDMGLDKDGKPKGTFERGVELRGRLTLLAEGARGSLSKQVINQFGLAKDSDHPKFGLGLKEVWRIQPDKHEPGRVQHSMGWPLDNKTGGGSFLYHYGDNLVSIGFVVHLNYQNPYLSPFEEFQRYKMHPVIRELLEGGERLSYGARAITEGGWQSVPKLDFPGGALIGCAAGFVNVPRIKGSHNAMLSGILAADKAFDELRLNSENPSLSSLDQAWRTGVIGKDLKKVRNVKPLWSKFGAFPGLLLAGLDMWTNTLGFSFFGTMSHGKADHETLKKAENSKKIDYPKPDGVVSFDRLSSVFLSGANHEENQPVHLRLSDGALPIQKNLPLYAEPAQRYCPAGVYEVIEDESGAPTFAINAQNCVHCKTCDIKDPAQNITWTVPEGGGGPVYGQM